MAETRSIHLLSIIGSPMAKFSNTYRIHQGIIKEAKGFHADLTVKTIFLSEQKINPSTGCITCLRKGYCPQEDDLNAVQAEILAADGIIFGSPCYMMQVSAQAKAFLDRCLGWAHRPPLTGKYVVAVSSSLGLGGDMVTGYLAQVWTTFGAQVVGAVDGQAIIKGVWLNREELEQQSRAAAQELIAAILERREYPAPEYERERFGRFRSLINMPQVGGKLFKADQEYWAQRDKEGGLG